jgi:hypothetical protein
MTGSIFITSGMKEMPALNSYISRHHTNITSGVEELPGLKFNALRLM